jgi:hypothetical protein
MSAIDTTVQFEIEEHVQNFEMQNVVEPSIVTILNLEGSTGGIRRLLEFRNLHTRGIRLNPGQ